jgi:HlyD family secretion protein
MKKKKSIFAVVILLLAVGWYLMSSDSIASEKKGNNKKSGEKTLKMTPKPLRVTVSTTGSVVSNLDVDIKCKASGTILNLPFDISDWVKKGDLILELDPVDENRAVSKARISLESTTAQLEKARQSLDISRAQLAIDSTKAEVDVNTSDSRNQQYQARLERSKLLLEKKIISAEEFEAAEAQAIQYEDQAKQAKLKKDSLTVQEMELKINEQEVRLAESRVDSDRIALEQAEQRLIETKVFSPIDGVVMSRNVQEGQIVSSGISNVGGGTTVLTVSDVSRMFIVASVDESDIGQVELEQAVEITADAHRGKKFKGKVVRIAPRGTVASGVVTFEVRIEVISRNKALLKPEMTANVEIIVGEKENILVVPSEAVSTKKRKKTVTVVLADGKKEMREITTGLQSYSEMEVVTGLQEGDVILVDAKNADSNWRNKEERGSGKRGMMMFTRKKK